MNKKNGGNVPVCNDERVKYVPVKCGECMECRKAIGREWRIRMLEEIKHNTNGKMITLTFSNESIKELAMTENVKGLTGYNKDNKIAKLATRRFLERWRKEYGTSLRHWFITELGSGATEHLHLHGIVWTNESIDKIREKWRYGNIWSGQWVNEQTINYTIKYVHKKDKVHENYKPIILTSPGMGSGYTEGQDANNNKYKEGKTKEYYRARSGHKIAMPVYWRNKIYTEEEREKLWLEKLDKQERWVDGIKIDISKGEETYYKVLAEAQEKSNRLGYGDDSIDWEKRGYENARRELKIKERAYAKKRPADTHEPSPAISHRSVSTKEEQKPCQTQGNNNDTMYEIGRKIWENEK